ncbi:Lactonase, 7-bladed beta-propeller-domain-containing protein [Cantharellus anzutake]|uniref:Lactonase, 7-bladed beta-propeller-domain-containing protein n=1 Tax=Cantharellus anzutake TaxID=1750568 RepID=UPI001904CB49|nr:Lactonase, 7-bladed beta-propeller-domain-containing protein [Cantharellus anzutake]KAF8329152.1 Lactonase, 7-bladed beta-propeller-domain-containing protein [Cantharellus anzutake]
MRSGGYVQSHVQSLMAAPYIFASTMPYPVQGTDYAQSMIDAVPETCIKLPNTLYLISGSFNVIFLYILAFNTQTRQLNVIGRTDAFGPHQYLTRNTAIDRLYTTTWAWPPTLSSWLINWNEWDAYERYPTLEHLNIVPITSTSSYITLTDSHIYSVGGPTGEVHQIDPSSKGFGEMAQQLLYVDPDELPSEDKTRSALRNGSHAVEFTTAGFAFVPHLGRNSIWMYKLDRLSGKLTFLSENKSPREGDAPRHVIPSSNEKYLYSVTEHTSFVDVYEIADDHLEHRQSASILPPGSDQHNYRGDTLRLSRKHFPLRPPEQDIQWSEEQEPVSYLFATTRGATSEYKGYLAAFAISSDGLILNPSDQFSHLPLPHIFQTPTSGGKANAIELAPYKISSRSTPGSDDAEWIVLTDSEEGWIFIVEWSGKRGSFEIISSVLLEVGVDGDWNKRALASHAIWLA